MWVVYETIEEANEALDTIYINMLEAYSKNKDNKIFNKKTKNLNKFSDKSRNTLCSGDYVLTGKRNGIDNYNSGYTTAWDILKETIDGEWAFIKPEQKYMKGLMPVDQRDDVIFKGGTEDE